MQKHSRAQTAIRSSFLESEQTISVVAS